jgi:hypothetical protein
MTPRSPNAGILLVLVDGQAIVNTLVTLRASVEQFARFLD